MVWITDHAPVDVALDSCVTCGLCLPVCPTFRLTGDESASPRGRLTAISAVGGGLAEVDQRFDEVTSLCLQCRACETACPSGVPFGDIIESARAEAVAQAPAPGSRVQRIVLGRILAMPAFLRVVTIVSAVLQRLGLLRLLPRVGDQTSGLRTIPLPVPTARGGSWGAEGAETITMFIGCVADPWFSDLHKASIELLVMAGYRVEAPSDQTCCGALAAHGGFAQDSDRLAVRNMAALRDANVIAVDVAGCGAHLKEYGRFGVDGAVVAARTRDITELIAAAIDEGRLPKLSATGERVVVQDPCHLEHGQGIVDQPRAILRAAGYTVVDADSGGLCCGAAGAYQMHHPEVGEELGKQKAEKVGSSGATMVASANAGCEIQLRRFLDNGYTIRHPIEIYADAIGIRGRRAIP
jgi:glycolate oxidase iron-sulfur subunit